MKKYNFPFTIDSGHGEQLTFMQLVTINGEERIEGISRCMPGAGPPFHTHLRQDEGFTVTKGTMAIQVKGGEIRYLSAGQSAVFKRGEPHRFWNSGKDELVFNGWVQPAENFIFFLSTLYESRSKSPKGIPNLFDIAFLLTKYKNEYAMTDLNILIRKIMIPGAYRIGKLTGKHSKFSDSPEPFRKSN